MPTSLSLSIPDLDAIATAEARVTILELACRIIAARQAAGRPQETPAQISIRNSLAGNLRQSLVTALTQEERDTLTTGEAITKSSGAALDGLGGTLGVTRNGGETDEDYRVRLTAANDLEEKPTRKALREAADTMLNGLLGGPGPVMDLVGSVVTDMAR